MGRQVAVAATGSASLAAAEHVVREGGNAVDAAVAAALASMSTDVSIVSLAAGGYISIWPAQGDPVVIDGNVEMPGRGLPRSAFGQGVAEVTTDYGGGVTMYAGYGAVATPGALPACQWAVEQWGEAPWSAVVAPSVQVCRSGYLIGSASAEYLGHTAESLFRLDAEAHALVTRKDGTPLQAGDTATNGALADVLDLIAQEGSSVVMTGEVGRALVATMAQRGGLITARDLAEYDPAVRVPVRSRLGSWDFAINPPPSIGGPMLAVMLGELTRRHERNGGWTFEDVLDIQHQVLGYRLASHDIERDLEAAGHDLLLRVERHGLAGLPTSSSTANVCATDSEGLACAVTVSSGYGAGVTIPGTGLLLNNALGEPELNRLGLHELDPGTRLASNMAPTTGRTLDGRALAIGSPGADRITTALLQVLAHGVLRGISLADAIDEPRVHVAFDGSRRPLVRHETSPAIAAAVAARRWPAVDHGEYSMYFGGVGAAYRRKDGSVEADGDRRREAAVGVFGG